jgi:hypothetical protein
MTTSVSTVVHPRRTHSEEDRLYCHKTTDRALINAVRYNNLHAVKKLVAKGVDPHAYASDALRIAIRFGRSTMLHHMIRCSPKINMTYIFHWDLLNEAVDAEDEDIMHILLWDVTDDELTLQDMHKLLKQAIDFKLPRMIREIQQFINYKFVAK